MHFDPGFDIELSQQTFGFNCGEGVFRPKPEIRYLDNIRQTLLDPNCSGPEAVYSIVMDIGEQKDKAEIVKRNLLYGAVTYATGTLGREPIRSQGHIHAISSSCGSSTPELYEIWHGEAYIYMQESAQDNPGRCFAIYAKPGDKVLVPPYWAHATISANLAEQLAFGAWCVRDFAFDYNNVRAHGGLAWFPVWEENRITWLHNNKYQYQPINIKTAREYLEFNIDPISPIYIQFQQDPDRFLFISNPNLQQQKWVDFIP